MMSETMKMVAVVLALGIPAALITWSLITFFADSPILEILPSRSYNYKHTRGSEAMKLRRLDETRDGGGAFAEWLRRKLFVVGKPTKRLERLARGERGAYVLIDDDGEGFARGEDFAFVGGRRWTIIPRVNGHEDVTSLAGIEADLFDGDRSLAVVCDANGAILVAASVWRKCIALHKGDHCAVLPAAEVRDELRRVQGDGGEGREG